VTTPRRSSTGAYGFRLDGVPDAGPLLVDAPESWPRLELVRAPEGARPETEDVTDDDAHLWLAGGAAAELDRRRSRALLTVPENTSDGALVHPFLAPVALIMARWRGHEGMHGGAVATADGVWAVLGDKTGGKSTTLASLALAGLSVFSDDVLVIADGIALAGPRSIDLREEPAKRLGVGEPMGRIGMRDRWRLALDPVPPELPLRGWISLAWGEEITVESLRGADRLAALIPHRGVRLVPTAPTALLELSALPHLRLTRPRRWDSLRDAAARLADAIAG
jgi:hypothetical protein